MAELPTGTVTFLFTDMEGSTRLLKELGGRYAEVLAEYRRILRAAFADHGGHEIDTQGYVGLGVHRAARICAAGHGGQVLLSRSTAGVVEEDEIPGVFLRDLGEQRLKDFDRPERIYQLLIEGLPDEFPPLKTLRPMSSNGRSSSSKSLEPQIFQA